jgi:methyl farnesoate epoxidase/farnesoate epoxidase
VTGNYPDLKRKCREKKYMHEALAALAREHNTPVLGLRLGTELTVVVFGYDLIKHVFTREEYDGRPDCFFIRLRAMGGRNGEKKQLGCIRT